MTIPTQARLLGGAAKTAKFQAFGDSVEGFVIAEPEIKPVTKMGTGEIDTFPSGDPKFQIIVTLQTTLREDEEDDGQRTVYIKSFMLKPGLSQAVQAAGAEEVEKGGWLRIIYTHNGEATRGGNAPKLFEVTYRKPNRQADVLGGQPTQPNYGNAGYPGGQPVQQPPNGYPQGQPVQNYAPQYAPQQPQQPQGQPYAQPQAVPQPAPQQYPPQQAAQPVIDQPTQAAIAAIIAAGMDPKAVYPNYQG